MKTGTSVGRNYRRAALAGFLATLAMGIFAYLIVPLAALPRLDAGFALGTLFLPDGATAMGLGLGIALLAGVAWALVYERIRHLITRYPEWIKATAWGLIAWIIAGIALGALAPVHPLVVAGEVRNPGFFGFGFEDWTAPVSIFVAFLLYGGALGLAYELPAGRQASHASSGRAAA